MKTLATLLITIALGGTAFAQAILVAPNSNVGIGTSSPIAKLDVNGSALVRGNIKNFGADEAWAENLVLIKGSGWGGLRLARNDPATGNFEGNWAIGYTGSTGNDFSISNNQGGVQSDALIHISSVTRNVGIRTTTPASPLTIASNNPNAVLITGSSGVATGLKIQNDNYSVGNNWLIANDSIGGLTFNHNGVDVFFMGRGGNGDAYSALAIHAPSFITPARTYADYVFRKDYVLPSLAEVETHINDKGHLPGVPSEKEALANGINVADFQVRLLAQIEQLTLHAISQEKRLKAQEQRIAELESVHERIKMPQ